MTPVRPTIIGYEKVAETLLGGLVHVIVGLFFMAGGAWLVYYGLQHPIVTVVNGVTVQSLNRPLVIGGGLTTLFGALLMPTILPLVQRIFVVVIPLGQQLPIIGSMFGRRKDDQPRSIEEPPSEPKP